MDFDKVKTWRQVRVHKYFLKDYLYLSSEVNGVEFWEPRSDREYPFDDGTNDQSNFFRAADFTLLTGKGSTGLAENASIEKIEKSIYKYDDSSPVRYSRNRNMVNRFSIPVENDMWIFTDFYHRGKNPRDHYMRSGEYWGSYRYYVTQENGRWYLADFYDHTDKKEIPVKAMPEKFLAGVVDDEGAPMR